LGQKFIQFIKKSNHDKKEKNVEAIIHLIQKIHHNFQSKYPKTATMLEWNDSQEHSFCIHIMLVSQTNHNPISPFFAYATPPTKRKSGTQRENRLSISSPVHTFANSNRQTRQQADDDLLLLLTNKQRDSAAAAELNILPSFGISCVAPPEPALCFEQSVRG
jgi:hypothetical protein